MIFAGELLKEARQFIEDGMSPQIIINGFWKALQIAREKLSECAIKINDKSEEEKRNLLLRCAKTSLCSKLIANYREFFSKMIVEAVEKLEGYKDKDLIDIKHVTGGSITDSFLVDVIALKKVFLMQVLNNNQKNLKMQKL